jgi:hypothetical protein
MILIKWDGSSKIIVVEKYSKNTTCASMRGESVRTNL